MNKEFIPGPPDYQILASSEMESEAKKNDQTF